jgi:outer membrane protein TolC
MPASYRPRRLAAAACGAILALAALPAAALTLAEALDAARTNDPQYQAATFELDSARQGLPIARAALLPSVQLTMSGAEYTGQRTFPNSLNQDVTVRVDYNAPQSQLSLRQPLFNYEGIHRYRQAQAVGRGAEATFRQRGLMLVDRVGSSYLQVAITRAALAVS